MAHERMLNDKGRKVVRERIGGAGGPSQSNDLFRNVQPQHSGNFDSEWESMANQLGFNYQNNRLAYAGNDGSSGFGGGGRQTYQ